MRNMLNCLGIVLALTVVAVPVGAERMLPPAPPCISKLVIVDWQPRGLEGRTDDLSIRTLQGLVNRKYPRIWVGLDERTAKSGWWLAKYKEMDVVTTHAEVLTKDEFLRRYKHYARGVVVPPANLGRIGYRVAVMKAAADDLIVGTPELADRLKLEVVEDYSTCFSTYAESWRYALDELWPRLSHEAILVDRDDLTLSTGTADYVVQHRLFLCGPHRDEPSEMKLFEELLSKLPHNAPVIGSVSGGGLCTEGDIVRAVCKSGKVFAGCTAVPNLTIHSGLEAAPELRQPMREAPKLDRGKVYVAVEISDGDNSNVWFAHVPKRGLWQNRGRVPLGWTMSQSIMELAPAVTEHYYDTRTELDEFIAGVSGHAYVFPGDFGNALTADEKEEAWQLFLKRTDDFLANADMRVVTTLHYQEAPGVVGQDVLRRYAQVHNAAAIINGYNAVFEDYGGKTYEFVDGLPIFHTVTDRTWSLPGDKTLADDVIERTPQERPAFMALFMIPFALKPDHFDQVVDSLKRLEREGYVLVLPSELADLARQADSATDSPQ